MAKKNRVQPKGNSTSEAEVAASGNTAIVFDGCLDISAAGQLREQLLQALDSGQSVILDGANVERIDTAALQVITAFFKDAVAKNVDVQWKQPSGALVNAARLLGLNDSLSIR